MNIPKPADSTWTDDQWNAIVSTGQDILVAAAAGSGKTAVLVERMIRKITAEENPIDVDRLLVVTFTNASAAEMKHRIAEALEKELVQRPGSLHIRRQLSLLNRASISTLHSFCLQVLKKYYYLIDLDPGFRIADQTEGELLGDEVLDELFEDEYAKGEKAFLSLLTAIRQTGTIWICNFSLNRCTSIPDPIPTPRRGWKALFICMMYQKRAPSRSCRFINMSKKILQWCLTGRRKSSCARLS